MAGYSVWKKELGACAQDKVCQNTERIGREKSGFGEQAKELCRYLICDERGVGVIEVVLILVVLIALVLIFKDKISSLLKTIFDQINSSAADVWSS